MSEVKPIGNEAPINFEYGRFDHPLSNWSRTLQYSHQSYLSLAKKNTIYLFSSCLQLPPVGIPSQHIAKIAYWCKEELNFGEQVEDIEFIMAS